MAHELDMSNGRANMFSVKERPWHDLGVILEDAPTIEEGIKAAGLDWEVGLHPLAAQVNGSPLTYEAVPGSATYRKDTGAILGVVGTAYTPLQNKDAFNFFDPFLESGLATLETAGSLFDGKKVWVMAKINRPDEVIIPGTDDRVESFVLLSNAHDGSSAVRVGFTPIRVVCNNTLTAAHEIGKKLIKVNHKGLVVQNLAALRDTMNLISAEFEATADQFRYLASRQISESDLRRVVKIVFSLEKPKTQHLSVVGNDGSSRVLDKVVELFHYGRGQMDGQDRTRWHAYNAITEYLTYYRGKNEVQRFNSLWFEDASRLNKRALNELTNLAA